MLNFIVDLVCNLLFGNLVVGVEVVIIVKGVFVFGDGIVNVRVSEFCVYVYFLDMMIK